MLKGNKHGFSIQNVISFLDQPDTIQMRELLVVVLNCSLGLQS